MVPGGGAAAPAALARCGWAGGGRREAGAKSTGPSGAWPFGSTGLAPGGGPCLAGCGAGRRHDRLPGTGGGPRGPDRPPGCRRDVAVGASAAPGPGIPGEGGRIGGIHPQPYGLCVPGRLLPLDGRGARRGRRAVGQRGGVPRCPGPRRGSGVPARPVGRGPLRWRGGRHPLVAQQPGRAPRSPG